ncbi:MAG: HAD family hydrolase [Fimbriimonadaceae bacterium]|nr:HAD family hydrolase [Fimbriimonadaceae bacterium]
MRYDLVICDYDGVLCRAETYTPDAIRLGLQRFAARVGVTIALPDEAALLGTLGYPSHLSYPPFIPEAVRHRWQEMHQLTLDAMEERIRALGPACLYPGAVDLLDALVAAGRILGLASNSSARYQQVHREVHHLDRWFRYLHHAQEPGITCKADMLARILAAEPGRRAVMVGDRSSDREAAAAHRLPFIACAYGYGAPDEWPGAVAVVDDLTGLGRALGLS